MPTTSPLKLRYKASGNVIVDEHWWIREAVTHLQPADPCMAEDASDDLASVSTSLSSLVPSSFFFRHFTSKSELLSYLMLCVAKMPFIPPVSIARSVSGLAGKERLANNTSPVSAVTKAKALKEDKGGSVKERLALNLKQLGKKSQPRSNLPTTKGVSGANGREGSLPSSQTGSSPVTSSESLSKRQQHKHSGHTSVKSDSQVKPVRTKDQQEVRFTLTLTPEAVLLLQRRNSERHRQHSAARNPASGVTLAPGGATESRRRRENVPKRQRNGSHSGRVTAKNSTDAQLGDISSIVKISLLNERHKYDDVEYEEEDDYGVDERVVLKCTEWLRGLENAPVTAGNRPSRSASSVKSF